MAIGLLSMLTPLKDRIDRWATSGNATKILLHPEDYLKVSDSKREKLTAKYDMPVEVLGGAKGIKDYLLKRNTEDEQDVAVTAKTLEEES